MFECPDAVLTCSTLDCGDATYLVFGGHDKTLYLMDNNMNIMDTITFDGWCRCCYPVDITGDGCEEILVGAGDGNFLVVKFVKGLNKLAGIMNYKTFGKVLCVTAGDFTGNGNIELILGGEDKTLKIFENIDSKEPLFTFYYDTWVTSCCLGYLKFPEEKHPFYGLLVGTRTGMLQCIRFTEKNPEIMWQRFLGAQINVIEVGDVLNDGYNEIVIGTDDSYIKILNSEGDKIKYLKTEGGRPITLKIEDIDGDVAKEIVVGCADGSLRVYHNPQLNSEDITLKWKTKISSSIKSIDSRFNRDTELTSIIYGGYDRSIRCITDFEWGKKPILDVPTNMVIPKAKTTKVEEMEEEVEHAPIKTVPTNIREYFFKILEDKNVLPEIKTKLQNMGYLPENIEEELYAMKSQKRQYEKIEYPVWTLPEEKRAQDIKQQESPEEQPKKIKPLVIEEADESKEGKLAHVLFTDKKAPEEDLKYVIMQYIEKNKLIPTKKEIIDHAVKQGYEVKLVESEIFNLRQKKIIKFSKADPRGWSLVG